MKRYFRQLLAKRFQITPGEVSILHAGSGAVVYRTAVDDLRNLIGKLHPVADSRIPLIRLGPTVNESGYLVGDGGYLVPNDLERIEACFSPWCLWRVRFRERLCGAWHGCLHGG